MISGSYATENEAIIAGEKYLEEIRKVMSPILGIHYIVFNLKSSFLPESWYWLTKEAACENAIEIDRVLGYAGEPAREHERAIAVRRK